jgi:uncharacterized membrane protein (GlpM family)
LEGPELDTKDLLYRFLFGGSAVVLSYVASVLLPWKIIGGIFAAFPAVMIVAVMMVGIKKGSKEAAKTANGSVYGMIGCFICVIAVLLMLKWTDLWLVSLLIGLVVWFFSSIFLVHLRENGVRK